MINSTCIHAGQQHKKQSIWCAVSLIKWAWVLSALFRVWHHHHPHHHYHHHHHHRQRSFGSSKLDQLVYNFRDLNPFQSCASLTCCCTVAIALVISLLYVSLVLWNVPKTLCPFRKQIHAFEKQAGIPVILNLSCVAQIFLPPSPPLSMFSYSDFLQGPYGERAFSGACSCTLLHCARLSR